MGDYACQERGSLEGTGFLLESTRLQPTQYSSSTHADAAGRDSTRVSSIRRTSRVLVCGPASAPRRP